MDSKFETVLDRYRARVAAEEKIWQRDPTGSAKRRDDFLLAVGEDVGRLLHALAIGRDARRILELGTSYGYSTLFLADAAQRTGGKVHTLELAAGKQVYARKQIDEAGLGAWVEWHLGDATQILRTLEGPFDLVLVDLWKDLYVPCLELFYPKLADNAVIVADNMLLPNAVRREAEAYRAAVKDKYGLQSVLLPIGNGIELSCLWRQEPA